MRIGIGTSIVDGGLPGEPSPPSAPVNLSAPVVSPSSGSIGEDLSVSNGVWSGSPTPTFTYQWRLDTVDVPGETSATVTTDAAGDWDCVVTATNSEGSAAATSSAATIDNLAAPVNTGAPSASPSSVDVDDAAFTRSAGTYSGNPTPTVTWVWRKGTTQIAGTLNQASYTPDEARSDYNVYETASNSQGSVNVGSANVSASLRTQATMALANQTFDENIGNQTYDVAPNVTANGNTLAYSLISPPTGVTIAGSVITVNTNVVPVSTQAITVRATDEYARTTDDSFDLTVRVPGVGRTAAVVVGIGQSLAAARGTIVQSGPGALNSGAQMPVGGAHISAMPFWAGNTGHMATINEFSSLSTFAEGGDGQSPLAGITNTLTGYDSLVLHSTAIGSQSVRSLQDVIHHPQAGVKQCVQRLVDGGETLDNIDVIFFLKHGERDAFDGLAQADYEEQITEYIFQCRLIARQALGDPSYVPKLHFSFPIQQQYTDDDRAIKKALFSVANTLSGVYMGEAWSVPVSSDRIHPDDDGMVLSGERVGYQIANEFTPMQCTSVTLDGTSFTATFNKNVVRDTSLGLAGSLNAANAEDGLEFWDGAAYVAITGGSLVYSGNTITGTLASAPASGELRIACQDTTNTLTNDDALHVGCSVRSDVAGWASTHDPTYTHYDWCIPQIVETT